ncbi:ferrous iron transport protein B [Enterococcus gilvus]|uniref:Ferrous iron transport protein B n=1 Tax=Enterococcus gilvus ATCC BAA-350 TaxID=1158614 RepID=R2VIB0_9ENTE|nr:ferrous iron transport protein B [Enterococcus gilvus]EOI57371.1 ferrous iron transporter B [Enterococcus gilvus ATCC BAA-350]EOW83055.1 ferrous iron transporter B [Enterococcus gilvus ATCC BAA-350]MBS5821240.1 ferrous iron transport protein B [Enterococcus gilvus]OJG41091.1 ferrous iron transporter B [Enterococcus gilvus]
MAKLHVALAGNPNSGKTSTFNVLTGTNQFVGNWPGVTVERKEGIYKKDSEVIIDDLPGIYSLSPYSPEEVVARDYLLSGTPDAIVNIIDGTNLERNLYLTTQLIETGIPVVVAVNMMDVIKKSGKQINLEKLAYALGVPVVGVSALKNWGLDKAINEALHLIKKGTEEITFPHYDNRLEAALNEIEEVLGSTAPVKYSRWYSVKLFERDERAKEDLDLSSIQQKEVMEIIKITEKIFGEDAESLVINERYNFITHLKTLCVVDEDQFKLSISDKIDHIVTNRFLALPIFALVMWLIYYIAIQTIGAMGTDWVNDNLFGDIVPNAVSGMLQSWNVAEWMQQLILNGILAGVGAVLGFLPQLMVLFLCLALLEDCGYMSRIAFVMDRIFRKFGLSGKSFIPMLIATGCGVPGVMASRTIENEKDRRMTAMLTTFMPCSAKLPIIALIAGAFFPNSSWVAPSAYFVGMGAIVLSGIALKKTKLFSGDPAPFIMELPLYHMPRIGNTLRYTYDHSKAFVKRAGTIIFVSSIVIWFISSYNFSLQSVNENDSILAALGGVIAPLFAPLGWGDWRGAVAAITGLVAKENVIGTFGILYRHAEVAENGVEIWKSLQGAYTPVAGYSFLVFNLLCAPCFAAIGAIHREMGDIKWTWRAIGYQCGLAYAVSFIVYQFGHVIFENGEIGIGLILAAIVLLGMIYFVVRKPIKKTPTVTIEEIKEVKEWQL